MGYFNNNPDDYNIGTPTSRGMAERAFGIEKQSFDIIESEIGKHNYAENQWTIVRRVIHATADFDFARAGRIIFSKDAIESAFLAFSKHSYIVTDVEMVLHGINKKSISDIGLEGICMINDPKLREISKKSNKTRSELAMRECASKIDKGIVIIGNAPTALYEVISMIEEKKVSPLLVIGIPVGFVSAVESKMDLLKVDVPFITNTGRKGGSSAASSIINSLMLMYLSKGR